ncbi:MAG: ErpK protein [Lachnospiraceae bacterium]
MARRKISIDDRIEQQKLVVSKAKDRYEAELEQLNQLMKKRDELRNKELLQAIEHSNRSFEEIMDFLGTDDSQN